MTLGMASSSFTSPSSLAAPGRTRDQLKSRVILTRWIPVRVSMQLQPFNAQRGCKKLRTSGPVGVVTALPAAERRRSDSIRCAAALNARCSASGQTQTLTREAPTTTEAPVREPTQTPKLDDGGPGLPPRDDGGGGGGGGGGNWSGGFFLFGFLAFLGFLKDKESEDYRDSRR